MRIGKAHSVAHEGARLDELTPHKDRRDGMASHQLHNLSDSTVEKRVGEDHEGIGVLLSDLRKGWVEVAVGGSLDHDSLLAT